MKINIGIGEYAVASDPEDIIKTHALGSCVALMIYDTKLKIGGMAHIAHPDSQINPERGQKQPAYFADTGIRVLLEELKSKGATRENSWIKIAGGAAVLDNMTYFDIGKENILAIRKGLWTRRLGVIKSDVGGNTPRTVTFYMKTGNIELSYNKKVWKI